MTTFEEFPVFVPMADDRLCAVVCAPAGEMRDIGVVLLTGGNYTRAHRNRMWVHAARALAERGFPSIRLDYHGVGDSTGNALFDLEVPFDADAVAAARFLGRATGVSRLVLVATCFGGKTAIAAAAQLPEAIATTVFPLPVMVPRRRGRITMRTRVKRLMRRTPLGTRLLGGRAVKALRDVAPALNGQGMVVSPQLVRDLTAFCGRGGEVRFVYGDLTPGLGEAHALLRELERPLGAAHRRVRLDVVSGTILERFQSLADQDIVVRETIASVEAAAGLATEGAGHAR